eukprot:TRINITY_DN11118_c0_g1_i1.p4 TRINITY_DN11118_c0_g1~~TRINITY_DN11118_c0_g1_i1.p4  ORF type:complete len:107 (+),score=31.32 TRINITY_DN11118_c0_g1_i1:90-410(+)
MQGYSADADTATHQAASKGVSGLSSDSNKGAAQSAVIPAALSDEEDDIPQAPPDLSAWAACSPIGTALQPAPLPASAFGMLLSPCFEECGLSDSESSASHSPTAAH